MLHFMRNLNRDPDPVENAGGGSEEESPSIGNAISNELENPTNDDGTPILKMGDEGYVLKEGDEGYVSPLKPGDEGYVAPEDEKPEIDIEGYKGKNRRGEGYVGEKRRQVDKDAENPSHEMSFEMEEGKGKHKLTLQDLKETAAFLHNNRNSLAASLKIREMATKNPAFGKLINSIIEKSHDGAEGAYNEEFVNKITTSLDAKADKVEDKIDETDEDIKFAEDLLNSDAIDPDSVQAQVLKNNIKVMKANKAQLTKTSAKIDELISKVGGVEKSHKTFLTDTEKAAETKEIDRVSGMFDKEFNILTDPKREKGYTFPDEEAQKDFEKKVRDVVSSESGKTDTTIKTDEDFVKLIRNTSEAVYKRIQSIRETYVNDYIKSKGGKVPGEGDAPKDTAVTVDDMKAQLAQMEKDGKKDSPEAVKLKAAIEVKEAEENDPTKGKTIGETIADAVFADA